MTDATDTPDIPDIPDTADAEEHDAPAPILPPLTLVNGPRQLQRVLERIKEHRIVAIDTESNSLHAYYERVCLIQLSVPEADYIIDPLAPQFNEQGNDGWVGFGAMLRDPAVQKIFHAAEYDIIGFKRDYQFEIINLFDTMQAARILGWQQVGLSALLSKHFGITLDKRLQRADWGQRPLSQELLAYARLDTRHLFALREVMLAELIHADRLAEALEDFAHIASHTEFVDKPFDPDGFWRFANIGDFSERQLAALRELCLHRDQQAERMNRPAFKVLTDEQLTAIARHMPDTPEGLRQAGLSAHQLHRFGQGLLAALLRSRSAPAPVPPRPRERPDDVLLARYDALRNWRKTRAKQRGVESDIILPRDAVWAIAHRAPRSLAELAEVSELGPWRRATYGEEIVKLLSKLK